MSNRLAAVNIGPVKCPWITSSKILAKFRRRFAIFHQILKVFILSEWGCWCTGKYRQVYQQRLHNTSWPFRIDRRKYSKFYRVHLGPIDSSDWAGSRRTRSRDNRRLRSRKLTREYRLELLKRHRCKFSRPSLKKLKVSQSGEILGRQSTLESIMR